MEAAKLGNLIHGTLNGKTIQMSVEEWGEYRDMWPRTTTEWLHLFTSVDSAHISFRVKPNTKVVKYQTRLYLIGLEYKTVYQWCSLTNLKTEKDMEDSYKSLKWLQPTQEHTFKYEETE